MNKFDVDFCGDIPCLKNLIILMISFASLSLLADILNVKVNGLKLGPLNNNSKFGLITAPCVLESNPVTPVADSAMLPIIAACASLLLLLTSFKADVAASAPAPRPLDIEVRAVFAAKASAGFNLSSPQPVAFDSDIPEGMGNITDPRIDRKSTRLNSSHVSESRMPSSA